MLRAAKEKAQYAAPPRKTLVHMSVLAFVILAMSFAGLGDNAELRNTLQNIGNFVSIIIVGVAVPNGAYGFLQYMTAGSNVDQDEKGRTRIRNTFIGLAGVAVIQIAVNVFESMIVPEDVETGSSDSFIAPVGETIDGAVALVPADAVGLTADAVTAFVLLP